MSEEMKLEEVTTNTETPVSTEEGGEAATTTVAQEAPAVENTEPAGAATDDAEQKAVKEEPKAETTALAKEAPKAEEPTEAATETARDDATTEEAPKAEEPAESMADYEDHFDDANPWNKVVEYMNEKTILPVKIEGVVNGGVIAMVEGLRGFVPASKLSLSYIEDLETYLLKDVEVQVIDVDQAKNRLILSARDILRAKEKQARKEKINSVKIGTVMEGVVETLQNYGAFIKLDGGLSDLVHVSQISTKRVNQPSDVLKVGDNVKVKVIAIKDGKISLSMKALEEKEEEAPVEKVVIPKAEKISTNLGDLLKGIKL